MGKSEPRKLIRFGNFSYVVSLPKSWIEKHNLRKGDLIYLNEGESNEMILMPKENSYSNAKEKKVEIDITDRSIDDLRREITSAYINNFSVINISGKDFKEKTNEIKEIFQALTGMEILEQTSKEMIIKDFLNIDTISPKKVVRRLDNSIRAMIEDVKTGLNETQFRNGLLEDIMTEDKSVNKMYLLLMKIAKMGISNRELLKVFDMTENEMSSSQWLAMNMEYLGDDVKRIARFLTKIKLTPKQKSLLVNNLDLIEKCFIDAMTAYHKEEPGTARGVLNKKETILKEIEKLCESGDDVLIGNICERLKMVYFSIYNIAKLIIY